MSRGLGSDYTLITWRRKLRDRSGLGERCERLPHGRCCSAHVDKSAGHKLWVRPLELRRSDLYREEQSWLVPQKVPSPRSVAWIARAPEVRGERLVAVATKVWYVQSGLLPLKLHSTSGIRLPAQSRRNHGDALLNQSPRSSSGLSPSSG